MFWSSTFPEVLLVIQGQVDKWRIERRNTYNLYCMWVKEPIPITQFAPLPYDNELQDDEINSVMTDAEIYALVTQSDNWKKIANGR